MKKYFYFLGIIGLSLFSNGIMAQSNYEINKKIPVEGDGFWDYITSDDANGRIFVSHSTMAQVINTKTGKIVGTIPDTKGIHGIAIAADLNKGFTSNGRDSSVTVFNLKTLAVITVVKVTGRNPDAILYDPFSQQVFTCNGGSNNSTVIDAKTNKVTTTIPLDGKPEFSVTDGKGNIYINIEDKSMIDVISAKEHKVIKSWSIAPGEEPSGLALDNDNHWLFSVCRNNLMVVSDAVTGKVMTTLPIGSHCDGAAFDPTYKRAYSSNGDGTVTVVQEMGGGRFKVLENIKTQAGARTMTVDKSTHYLYLPVAEYESEQGQGNHRPAIKPGTFAVLEIRTLK